MDDDLIYGLICIAVGSSPFLLLALIVWAVRGKNADPRTTQLESDLTHARMEVFALSARVQKLEAWARTVTAVETAPAVVAATSPAKREAEVEVAKREPARPQAETPMREAEATRPEAAAETARREDEAAGAVLAAAVTPLVTDAAAALPGPLPVAPTAPAPVLAASPTPPVIDAAAATPASSPVAAPAVLAPSSAPAPPPPPSPPRSTPPPASPPFSPEEGGFERWLGVRGAAAAGAIVLAIAGAYFFEYSIEHGLIGPSMRVALGVLVGLGCLGLSEWKRHEYEVLTSWVAGAGIAILYTASWASHAIYELVPSWAAGILMIAVTAACAAISSRRDSLATAVLGLMGGFLTPLALSTGQDRPVPLFSYLLLLDVGLLWLSYRKRWPALAWLSLVGTALYQLGWLGVRMSSETGWLGIGIVLVFGLLYGGYATLRAERTESDAEDGEPPFLAAVSTLLPFLLALTFAGRDVLSDHLYVVGGLVIVLSIGALFVAHRAKAPFVALAAAAGALGVLAVWMLGHALDTALAWELVAVLTVLALVFHVAAERDRGSMAASSAGLLSLYGGAAMATIASLSASSLPPFVALAIVVAIVGVRHAELPGRWWTGVVAGLTLAASLFAIEVSAPAAEETFYGALSMVLVALFQIPALVRRSDEGRRGADHGAAVAASALLLFRVLETWSPSVPIELGSELALVVLVLFAASRLAAPAHAAVALALAGISASAAVFARGAHDDALPSLALLGAAVLLFTSWPAIAGPRYRTKAWAWRSAALAGPVYFFVLRQAWIRAWGPSEIGILPVALAVVSLGTLMLARMRGPTDHDLRRTALAWPAAITAGFITLAIPLQLSNEWLTLGWALEGAAVLWLFRRIDHAGLKWLAAGLFAAVATRLLLNPYVLGYYPRGDLRIVNWLAYTYLVPAAAMIAGYFALAPIEVERLRPLEQTTYPAPQPLLARTLFAGALATIFAWLNLAIIDWYATGPGLSIPTEHMPARDLTISIVWAVYALFMLGLGVWRQSQGLRWTSLALIVITCFKVFLYDLSHLHDLYRVAALVGLAMSLLAVSLLYQRFVFRRPLVAAPEAS